ncbi:secreted protein [Melampsora americana]|nr:secreted protein [Melampsora americana]
MTLITYLTFVVMCVTMSSFLNTNSVNALTLDCRGGYNTGFYMPCFVNTKGPDNSHKCDPKNCHRNNVHFVQFHDCVPFRSSGPPSTQNCLSYNYYDEEHYSCTNAAQQTFKCPHKYYEGPFITCTDCTG